MMSYPIELKSERMITRGLKPEDIEIWDTFIQDKDATRLFPESMRKPDTAKVWIEKQIERYDNDEFGLLALIHCETGEFIGQCGLLLQKLEHGDEIEIGYHILPKYWGQGYASEAAQLFRAYAQEDLGLKRVVSVINPENTGSQKVAERNGMTVERQISYRDMPADLWVWEADQNSGA